MSNLPVTEFPVWLPSHQKTNQTHDGKLATWTPSILEAAAILMTGINTYSSYMFAFPASKASGRKKLFWGVENVWFIGIGLHIISPQTKLGNLLYSRDSKECAYFHKTHWSHHMPHPPEAARLMEWRRCRGLLKAQLKWQLGGSGLQGRGLILRVQCIL